MGHQKFGRASPGLTSTPSACTCAASTKTQHSTLYRGETGTKNVGIDRRQTPSLCSASLIGLHKQKKLVWLPSVCLPVVSFSVPCLSLSRAHSLQIERSPGCCLDQRALCACYMPVGATTLRDFPPTGNQSGHADKNWNSSHNDSHCDTHHVANPNTAVDLLSGTAHPPRDKISYRADTAVSLRRCFLPRANFFHPDPYTPNASGL